MLNQITDSFFSKLMEKLVEYAFDTFSDKRNLESTLEAMKNSLNSLSDKAFDVEDKIKNTELSGKKKRKREVEQWLKQVNIIESEFRTLESEVQTQGFLGKFFNRDQLTQLNAKIHELVEQSQHFRELIIDVYEMRGEALLTTNLCGKGFKENLKRIWNLLKSDNVSSIGIYGMGGVGKTALVRHINNMILEKRKEKRVCWITVSQVFGIKKLQEEIAHSIDNVWENIYLQKLGDPLHLEGCRLILTTRSFEVCCRMGCQEKVEVEKLRKDEAWNLFKQELKQDTALSPEIEEIAMSMVKICDGLPLGIIALAGSMRGETSVHVWRNELEKLRDPNMVRDDQEHEVFKVLNYSFARLDLNHQLCFLHCSLYPEDSSIQCRAIQCFLTNKQFLMANQGIESRFLPLWNLEEIKLIGECNKMRKLGLPSSAFQNIEEISIHNCDEIEDIIEVQQEEGQAISLLKLKVLSLCHLPRLKSICNTKISCGSINTIQLFRCRELKKLPLYFGPTSNSPPQTLERIAVWEGDKEWWESLEWEHPSLSHLLQPLVEYLTVNSLYVYNIY
ncbi:hypothetical protein CDL12_00593 [Handroanthus impetiginosus]|uniref:NB-ARC domain-containing protein n=1 Tax=Handroanthus impetiginosus TaxID=429701 RepID=A0A2G9IAG6_9LAMI|nr:hypothetical protein CDL12_00593 [Handroanthus impetiginosus]